MQRAFIAILIAVCACTTEPTAPDQASVRYLSSADFVDRSATITAETPFRSVGLLAELPESVALQFRVGTGAWEEVPASWREGGYLTATIILDAAATEIELRADLAPSFVRVELSESEELLGEHEGALDEGDHAALPHPGMWQPPASTLAIGDGQYLPYLGAYGCSGTGTLRPGARDIADMLRASFPGATSYGGYNCRKIAGTNTWSVHSTGRAIDLFVTTSGGQADNGLGDPIANWLIEHAEYLGISFLVWDRASWGAHRPVGQKHRYYSGAHPHHDHIHIEVTEAAAQRATQWFADGRPGPGGGGGGCRPKANASCSWADWVIPNRVLHHGDSVDSCDGRFRLVMQGDGNLVLYQHRVGALWSTGTHGTGATHAVMQGDGNLVVYAWGTPLWASGTHGHPGAIAVVQSDGNLVVHGSAGPIWASGTSARSTPGCGEEWVGAGDALHAGQSRTSCDGRFQLTMQGDGNLVLYQRAAPPVWSTGTNGTGASMAAMQGDGNLVLYAGGPVWSSQTFGHPGAALAVQSDGNVVIYGGGQALWASGTSECH